MTDLFILQFDKNYLRALRFMAAKEQGLPAMVTDALVRLSLYVATFAVATQHTRLEVLEHEFRNEKCRLHTF